MFVKNITNQELVIGTPAKVNLFLEVLNMREDGYHDIYSLFQAVSLFDRLTVRRIDNPGVQLSISGPERVESGPNNLVHGAYTLLQEEFDLAGGLHIELQKNIPVASGLAGGSADAAATLLACNELFELGLSHPELATLALNIGSDCPFFFSSGQALVSGRGEHLEGTTFPMDYYLVLVSPGFGVSTSESYARLKRGLTERPKRFSFGSLRTLDDFVAALRQSANDFEGIHLETHPELTAIRDGLMDQGARLARMSGSGPTIFGLFDNFPEFDGEDWFKREHWRVNTVKPVALPYREH